MELAWYALRCAERLVEIVLPIPQVGPERFNTLEDKIHHYVRKAGEDGSTLNQIRDQFASRSRPTIPEAKTTLRLLVETGKIHMFGNRYYDVSVRPFFEGG